MLTLVDRMLQVILLDNVSALGGSVTLDQVFFEPPNGTQMSGSRPRLSVYLAEVRENVKLRSNERKEHVTAAGTTVTRRAPYRLDCHYIISPHAPATGGLVPLVHELLYQTTEALVRSQPLIPLRVLDGHPEIFDWPEVYRDVELPLTVNPPEGFPKLAEFWGTMSGAHPWRPVVHAVVTVPVEHIETTVGGIVHHTITIHRVGPGADDQLELVAGTVHDRAQRPVPGARVFALDAQGVAARTACDAAGRFTLELPPQVTEIYAAAFGLGTTPRLTLAALASADYVLRFT